MSTADRVSSMFFLTLGTGLVFALYGGWCVGTHAVGMGCMFITLALAVAVVGATWRPRVPVEMDLPLAKEIAIEIPVAFDADDGTTREIQQPLREVGETHTMLAPGSDLS